MEPVSSLRSPLRIRSACRLSPPASPEILAAQLDSVLSDLTPQAIKIGMLGNKTAVQVVAEKLSAYPDIPVVLDPVLISTSGRPLAAPDAIAASQELLFPRATL